MTASTSSHSTLQPEKPAVAPRAKWYQSRAWLTVLGLTKLGLVALFASLAINSGSVWQWLVAFVFFFGAIGDFIQAVRCKRS